MKISQYIRILEEIQEEHGDLEVERERYDGHRCVAHEPTVDYRAILKSKRESMPRFYSYFEKVKGDEEGRMGEKVCHI